MFHDEVVDVFSFVVFEAVDGCDVGVIERRQSFGFALKTCRALRVGGERFRQDFYGDLSIEVGR